MPEQKVKEFEARSQELADREAPERMQNLLDGKIEPPNKFVAHLLQKVKQIENQMQAGNAQLAQMKTSVRQIEVQLIALSGKHNAYIETIKEWDKELLEAPQDETETD